MPIAGLGLHFLIALFFAVHALRSGREMYWLFILFSFPLLGSLAYFLVVFLPQSRLQRGLRKAGRKAMRSLDPGRELREAQVAFELTPTAQNQMRLAAALQDLGRSEEALEHYNACLRGPFATDPEMRLGAALASLDSGRGENALGLIRALQQDRPDFRAESLALLLAETLAATDRPIEAQLAFQDAMQRFGSFEVRARYAIWAFTSGRRELGENLKQEIERDIRHWERHTRDHNHVLLKQLENAAAPSRA